MKPNSTSIKQGQRLSPSTEFEKGQMPWNKGKTHSDETRKKLSLLLKGRPAWNRVDLSGKKVGRLFIVECIGYYKTENKKNKRLHYKCMCNCGNEIIVAGNNLTNRGQVSCGCFSAEQAKDRWIKSYGEASFNSHYYRYKRWAKKRNILFALSNVEFKEIVIKSCYYCGDPPTERRSVRKHNGYFVGNGIDRVNNNNGYTLENSVACCKHCNIAKSTLTVDAFFELVEKIYINHNLSSLKENK